MSEHKEPPPDLTHLLKEFGAELAIGFIHTAADIFEMFHASPAFLGLDGALSWAEAAVVGAGALEGGAVATVAEWAGPLGMVIETGIVLYEVHGAFSTGEHIEHQMGFAYGLVWAATNRADVEREFQPWAPNSAEELREAWQQGVNEAHEKFNHDRKLHDQVLAALKYERAHQSGHFSSPEERLLNRIWSDTHEDVSALKGTELYWSDHAGDYGVGQYHTPTGTDACPKDQPWCGEDKSHGHFGHSPHAVDPTPGFGDRPEDQPSGHSAPGFGHNPHAVDRPPGFGK